MSSSIWRFLVVAVVSLSFFPGLVEIPLVVGSAGDLGGSTSLSHMVPRTVSGSSFVSLQFAVCNLQFAV